MLEIGDGDKCCGYKEFEVLWDIHSEMLSRNLDIPDRNSERFLPKRGLVEASGLVSLPEIGRVRQGWVLSPGRYLYLGNCRRERSRRILKMSNWKVKRKTREAIV